MSHDLEGFVSVVAGREMLLDEIQAAPADLREYLTGAAGELLAEPRFVGRLARVLARRRDQPTARFRYPRTPGTYNANSRNSAMKQGRQGALYCRCGRAKIVANGHCATCYTLRRQDEANFGGLREAVLERDGHACRVCGASGRDKRSITVHHRVPGRSVLHLMISICPACHARVHRTKAVLAQMPPLLLELWREQHPHGHEQTSLNFTQVRVAPAAMPLLPLQPVARPAAGN